MRCVAAAVLCAAVALPCSADPVVNIPDMGSVEGGTVTVGGFKVDEFLGIEYATAGRWQSPVMQQPWEGMRQAKSFGPTCHGSLCLANDVRYESEDCLFLNVYRASATNATKPVPVMVFIHGGGYQLGCSDLYQGQALVARSEGGVIAVTLNYRLNAFGFLGHDSLRATDNSTGNWGLQDQRTALQWVQKHIGAFGGDPEQVTIFGQSAGGASVSCHLTAPRSRGLYKRAIAESLLAPTWAANPLNVAEERYASVLKHSGCENTTCLHGLSTGELVRISDFITPSLRLGHRLTWAPVIDGVELTQQPWQYFEAGDFSQVDILAGTMRDEMAFFLFEIGNLSSTTYDEAVVSSLKTPPLGLEQLRDIYSNTSYEYPEDLGRHNYWWWAAQRTLTDAIFTCPNRRSLRWLAPKIPSLYSYFMVHSTKSHTVMPTDGPNSVTVAHGEELPYVFDCQSFPLHSSCTWQREDERQLALDISGFWINFAKEGKPGGEWTETYNTTSDRHFVLDIATKFGGLGFHYQDNLRTRACDFWDKELFP